MVAGWSLVTSAALLFRKLIVRVILADSPWSIVTAVGSSELHYAAHATPRVKKNGTLLFPISSPNIDQFSKFFHQQTQQGLCNELINKDPTAS